MVDNFGMTFAVINIEIFAFQNEMIVKLLHKVSIQAPGINIIWA